MSKTLPRPRLLSIKLSPIIANAEVNKVEFLGLTKSPGRSHLGDAPFMPFAFFSFFWTSEIFSKGRIPFRLSELTFYNVMLSVLPIPPLNEGRMIKSVSLTCLSERVRNMEIVRLLAFKRKAMKATIENIENTAILS